MDERTHARYMSDIAYFLSKMESEPNSGYFIPIALAYNKLEKYDETIAMCKTAVERFPSNCAAKTFLAEAYVYKGQFDLARGLLLDVTSEDDNNYKALKLLGIICRHNDEKTEALKYLTGAYIRAPEDEEVKKMIDELGGTLNPDEIFSEYKKKYQQSGADLEEDEDLKTYQTIDQKIRNAELVMADLVSDSSIGKGKISEPEEEIVSDNPDDYVPLITSISKEKAESAPEVENITVSSDDTHTNEITDNDLEKLNQAKSGISVENAGEQIDDNSEADLAGMLNSESSEEDLADILNDDDSESSESDLADILNDEEDTEQNSEEDLADILNSSEEEGTIEENLVSELSLDDEDVENKEEQTEAVQEHQDEEVAEEQQENIEEHSEEQRFDESQEQEEQENIESNDKQEEVKDESSVVENNEDEETQEETASYEEVKEQEKPEEREDLPSEDVESGEEKEQEETLSEEIENKEENDNTEDIENVESEENAEIEENNQLAIDDEEKEVKEEKVIPKTIADMGYDDIIDDDFEYNKFVSDKNEEHKVNSDLGESSPFLQDNIMDEILDAVGMTHEELAEDSERLVLDSKKERSIERLNKMLDRIKEMKEDL